VGKNDFITLVEGFSDWPENAAMWRTEVAPYATTHRDYPSQDINVLRRYSQTPFPSTLTVQAETADAVTGAPATNPAKVYCPDLGVQTTTDTGGGWNVGYINAGETETWDQLPMQGSENLTIRVGSPNTGETLRFVIDGVAGPTITVPDTGGWQNWQTISAGTFQFNPGTYHTVQVQYLTGGSTRTGGRPRQADQDHYRCANRHVAQYPSARMIGTGDVSGGFAELTVVPAPAASPDGRS
jgi:DUF5010 C-terminal domain/Domain of unknown function (DUF5010)